MTGGTPRFAKMKFISFVILSAGFVIDAAPRSKSKSRNDAPQLVYDQKQTGDYNIQLHLKDFQIIALLGDDSLGDYDYNYDYADFTIKPSGPSTTLTTPKPASFAPPSSSTSPTPSIIEINSTKPLENLSSDIVNASSPIDLIAPEPLEGDKPQNSSVANNIITSTPPEAPHTEISPPGLKIVTESPPPPNPIMTQGKIKVQILDAPSPTMEIASAPLGIIPTEDVNGDANGGILQGELASYRKCVAGFARDKRGRCRRVRKPGMASQLPFGFGRIAGNLATRLRLPTHGGQEEAAVPAEK